MRNSLFLSVLFLSATVLSPSVGSASDEAGATKVDESTLPTVLAHGDAAAGQAKAASCGACHGANGVATVPEYPNLAGQGAGYMVSQVMHFKNGTRENPVMAGMVAALEEQDAHDIAAYYASQPGAQGESNATDIELGESIYRGGVPSVGVPACSGCHGPAGVGNDAAGFPRLAGQNQRYTTLALQAFRAETRLNVMMNPVAKRLTDREIAAVANYIQGLY